MNDKLLLSFITLVFSIAASTLRRCGYSRERLIEDVNMACDSAEKLKKFFDENVPISEVTDGLREQLDVIDRNVLQLQKKGPTN